MVTLELSCLSLDKEGLPEVDLRLLMRSNVHIVNCKSLNDSMTQYIQIEIFKGDENIITMNQTHSKTFHCTYLLQYYPFDTQVYVQFA